MPTSAAGTEVPRRAAPRAGERGFTLVEVMVVLAVMGVLAAAVMLTLPDPRGRLVDDAERFAARVVAARDDAIVEGRAVAVRITPAGYAFDRESDGRWVPVQDPPFRSTPWAAGTRANLGTGEVARVSFDPTGLVGDPAQVTLVRDAERVVVTIGADGRVAVTS